MSNITLVKIDVTKIEKKRLFKGEKGIYLDAAIIWKEDQYGNDGMIVQQVSKEERKKGIKGNILGNVKNLESKPEAPEVDDSFDDMDSGLPF